MPRFEITAPDGRRMEVNGPEGSTMEQAIQWAQQNMPAARERSTIEQVASGAGQYGAGINQGIAALVGGPFDLVNRGLRAVGVPIPEGSVANAVQRGINGVVGEPAEPNGTIEQLLRGAGRGTVDAATMVIPAAAVARATQVAGQAPTLINRASTALASQPVMQGVSGAVGGAVGDATDSQLAGTAAAFATPLAASLAGRMITPIRTMPNPERQALVAAAEREGIPVTAGQATGSRFLQNIEGMLEQLPFTSGPQRAIREAQERAFTAASLRRAGVNSDVATPDVLNAARTQIGGALGAIANRNTLDASPPQFLNDLVQASNEARRYAARDVERSVLNRIDDVLNKIEPGDTIPGRAYRELDSDLGKAIRGAEGDMRTRLNDLRQIMRNQMDASISPADAAEWARLRREYANLMVSARAAGGAGAGAAQGQISPLSLRGALNQSTGGNYAFGQGDQNELARIGQSVLRAPPDSGTAGRTAAGNLLTLTLPGSGGGMIGAALGGPLGAAVGAGAGLAAPRLAQMLMNSATGQAYLRNNLVQDQVLTRQLLGALAAQQSNAAVSRP